jgi:hypothetical protein
MSRLDAQRQLISRHYRQNGCYITYLYLTIAVGVGWETYYSYVNALDVAKRTPGTGGTGSH